MLSASHRTTIFESKTLYPCVVENLGEFSSLSAELITDTTMPTSDNLVLEYFLKERNVISFILTFSELRCFNISFILMAQSSMDE